MPYIVQERRARIAAGCIPLSCGELNYAITMIIIQQRTSWEAEIRKVIQRYVTQEGISYTTINNVVGALTCAAYEFRRRTGEHFNQLNEIANEFYFKIAADYEDRKISENGDLPYAALCISSRTDSELY